LAKKFADADVGSRFLAIDLSVEKLEKDAMGSVADKICRQDREKNRRTGQVEGRRSDCLA